MKYINSPIQSINFRNKNLYIKRDDLLDLDFSGNKARKFFYYIHQDFSDIDKIVSYGSAQANSLYSLAVLAQLKNVQLDFYVSHIAPFLKDNPVGNYQQALLKNANIIDLSNQNTLHHPHEYIMNEVLPNSKRTIFIEEGGRVQEAQVGIQQLALEIELWAKEKGLKNLKVMLPSGTGTTALFLQKYLPYEVLTCTCVGDDAYLKKQFLLLNPNEKEHPTILPQGKKYHFGKLYRPFYDIHEELLSQTDIEFDLLYDSLGWMQLVQSSFFENDKILYIHQGGLLGNISMSARYKNKYKLS